MSQTTHHPHSSTVDPAEVERFSRIADEWWDPTGKFAPLHVFNPCRLGFIREQALERFGRDGAERARALATPFIKELRSAVGLRSLAQASTAAKPAKAAKAALPTFKQYREADGKFYFKLVDADGRLLLQSTGFDAPKDAGQAIARLQREGLGALAGHLAPVDGVAEADVAAALAALAAHAEAAA